MGLREVTITPSNECMLKLGVARRKKDSILGFRL